MAPTVALCEQQREVIENALPVSVRIISGAHEPNQWKNASLWTDVLATNQIIVSTPQVLLDALRHGYILLGTDVSLMVFDEAHHAVDNHPYNRIMLEFYFHIPPRGTEPQGPFIRPHVLGLTASPIYGGNVDKAFRCVQTF
jgi:endoribonuclease Dicer